jgi:hypothetical protein
LQWVITDRVVNGSPVWAAEGSTLFMYRSVRDVTAISGDEDCATGRDNCYMLNEQKTAAATAPTALPSDGWVSNKRATLVSMYRSGDRSCPRCPWVRVPSMRIAVMHGLSDDDATMAVALRQLAALA